MPHIIAQYRPDIDGLRAIAVMLVILDHFGVHFFSGGFVGVDVFFVISGYLITDHMVRDHRGGDFSFIDFYARRAKRLLPAFYLVILTCGVVGLLVLSPTDLAAYARSVRYALVFISNLLFAKSTGYFDPQASEIPLLHTWSLGIEEQYYFFWPLLLAALLYCLRSSGVVIVTILLAAAGFLCSEWLLLQNPTQSYFLIQSRFGELLIGGVLALVIQHQDVRPASRPVSAAIGLIGLAMIFGSGIVLSGQSSFPGLLVLIPCLGTVFAIYAGFTTQGLSRRLLALRPLVAIGVISYSLYLWHWPIWVFLTYLSTSSGPGLTLGALLLTFAVAYLSWRFVETPLRRGGQQSSRKVLVTYFLIPSLCLLAVVKWIEKTEGLPQRFSGEVLEVVNTVNQVQQDFSLHCLREGDGLPCSYGVAQAPLNTLVWGDSHGFHLYGMMDELAKLQAFRFQLHGAGGCAPLLEGRRLDESDGACLRSNRELVELMAQPSIEHVVLAGRWALYTDPEEIKRRPLMGIADAFALEPSQAFQSGLRQTVAWLLAQGKSVTIVQQIPDFPFNGANCEVLKVMYQRTKNCAAARSETLQRQQTARALFDELKEEYPQIRILDFTEQFCDQEYCYPRLDGWASHTDDNHLNLKASRQLARYVPREIFSPFEQ